MNETENGLNSTFKSVYTKGDYLPYLLPSRNLHWITEARQRHGDDRLFQKYPFYQLVLKMQFPAHKLLPVSMRQWLVPIRLKIPNRNYHYHHLSRIGSILLTFFCQTMPQSEGGEGIQKSRLRKTKLCRRYHLLLITKVFRIYQRKI